MNHIEDLKQAFEHIAMARQQMDKGPAYSKIVAAQEILIGVINQMKTEEQKHERK